MILNARDRKLSDNTGTLPDVSGALLDWFQPMVFDTITKTIENFKNKEFALKLNFRGVIQPFSAKQLSVKPEGQRGWTWQMLHSDIALPLRLDDTVNYHGVQYRVMAQNDFSLYGYFEYHLVQDFIGAGP